MFSSLVVIVIPSVRFKFKDVPEIISRSFNSFCNSLADYFSISPIIVKDIILTLLAILSIIIFVEAILAFFRCRN